MKYLFILLFCFSSSIIAQDTWFNYSIGIQSQASVIVNDTVYSLCNAWQGNHFIAVLNRHDQSSGFLIRSDTFKTPFGESKLTNNACLLFDSSSHSLKMGISFIDTAGDLYKYKAGLFEGKDSIKRSQFISVDTCDTYFMNIIQSKERLFGIITWQYKFASNGGNDDWYLVEFTNDDTFRIISKQVHSKCVPCPRTYYHDLVCDQFDDQYLYLTTSYNSDFTGTANSWQHGITKLDTLGNISWTCFPNANDSFNTSSFKLIQKSNGNLICIWSNLYYKPNKSPSGMSQLAELNKDAGIWYAEIEANTGKVLWRKEITAFIKAKMPKSDFEGSESDINFNLNNVIHTQSGLYWVGSRIKLYNYTGSYKYLPIIIKTDFDANPIWIRETELFKSDLGDRGFQVYHATLTETNGFLLSGEYTNTGSAMTNFEFWRRASLLKLDSFGCLAPNCQKTRLLNINNNYQIDLYPNPGNGCIQIDALNNDKVLSVQIFNSEGKFIYESETENNFLKLENSLVSGIYWLKIRTTKGSFTKKYFLEYKF